MIDQSLLLIGALTVVVVVAVFSRRTGVAAPLILLVVGVAAGFIPGMPDLTHIPPAILLDVILPPLLYAAAVNLPAIDFRRNLPAIAGLSIVLVILTTAVTGLLLYAIFPNLNLAAALAVGAVISPTDAVAATSIAKRLGLPERLVTVLEGESLVNDATALVVLRTAVAAITLTTGGDASADLQNVPALVGSIASGFVFSVLVGAAVGAVVGYLTVAVRARLSDPVLTTAISFGVPFVAFLPADHLGASGVLATVIAGLITGHRGATAFAPAQRVNDHTNWRTVQFLLEEGVFLVMGLEFKPLIDTLSGEDTGTPLQAIGLGALLTAVLVGLRALYVLVELPVLRLRDRRRLDAESRLEKFAERVEEFEPATARQSGRKKRATRGVAQRRADLDFFRQNGLGLRGGTVIAWAGMRGVVTLAAAQSLPDELEYRSLLIVIAFTVAVLTLLVFGGTLPLVIRLLGVQSDGQDAYQRELHGLLDHVNAASLSLLQDPTRTTVGGRPADPRVLELLRDRFTRLDTSDEQPAGPSETGLREQLVVLRRRMRDAAREELQDARAVGAYSSRAISTAQDLYDLADAREDRLAGEF